MISWGALLVSILVLTVAFMQWRTAQKKLILDLFERRMGVFSKTMSAASQVVRRDNIEQALDDLSEAALASRFLFGPEVVKKLEDFHAQIRKITGVGELVEEINSSVRNLDITVQSTLNRKAAEDHARQVLEEMHDIAKPYMLMDEKLFSLCRWFDKKNEFRKSFADKC